MQQLKKLYILYICLFSLVLINAFIFITPCYAAGNMQSGNTHKTVKVAMLGYPNFLDYDENGNPVGFVCDYLDKVANYTGWEYEYIPMSFSDAQTALVNGDIDIVAGSQYTEERAKLYDYSKNAMTTDTNVICVKADNTSYYYNDYESLAGKRIGVMEGSVRAEQLQAILKKKNILVRLCTFQTNKEEEQALNEGKVDAVLIASMRCTSNYRIIASFNPTEVYFTCNPKDSSIKEEIDRAQDEILSVDPYYNMKLYEKHYGDIPMAYAFSQDERDFLKNVSEITVAVSTDMKPYEYYDESSGSFKGLVIDYFTKISENSGLQFHFTARKDTEDMLQELNNGNIQLIASISVNGGSEKMYPITLTDSYYSSSAEVVYNSSVDNPLDTNCRIVLKSGFPQYEKLAQAQGYTNIVYCDSFEQCVQQVNDKQADVTYLPGYSAIRMLDHAYLNNIREWSAPIAEFECAIGVSDLCDERLISILNKSLSSITMNEKSTIFTNAVSNNQDEVTLKDIFYKNLTTILCSILIISLAIGGIALYSGHHRKKLNVQLMQAKDAAEIANIAKSDFLSRMSHDMRTPMNGIIGLTRLTRDMPGLSKEIQDNLEAIDDSSKYLLSLINDVLDMNKIESEKLILNPEVVAVKPFIDNIIKSIKPLAEDKSIAIQYTPIGLQAKYVRVDKMRMQQIFVNILSNAIKFTAANGKVEIKIELLKHEGNKSDICVSIEDSGVGMSPEFLPHLFEPFAQEKETLKLNYAGTGLGMSIVKNLVDLMDGKIEAESQPNVGTKIHVFLQLECVYDVEEKSVPEKSAQEYSLEHKRALLVEDHPLNAKIAIKLLEKKGMFIEHAENGKIGVDMFDASALHYYDVVLMDIRMPVMDGLEATKVIRSLEREDAKQVPIIAMTANAFTEDMEKSLNAGMTAHLTKPINPEEMYETIAKYL